ncbi:MAG: helicase-related protein [bacterium]|nr:helicase-related protein [bacterium]
MSAPPAGGFRDLDLDSVYDSSGDPLGRFYVPTLSRAVRYDRVAGYFMSSAFATAAAGLARFIANDGTVRLLVGARLSPADCAALQGHARLEETLERRLLAGDELDGALSEDIVARHRLQVIAWLVRQGRLSIRVGLPCDAGGNPLPAESPEAQHYFHAKWGVLTDAGGDRVAFCGSINESASGWKGNFESISVYRSWEAATWAGYGEPWAARFERLWRGDASAGWRSVPLPEAVQERLLDLLPDDYTPPARDPLEPPPEPPRSEPSEADLALVEAIRAAPGSRSGVGLASAGLAPWPHQLAIARRIVDDWPSSYLLADEVGLGKTIEAGLVLRELLLSERIRTALLLVPASLLRQWQEELAEKFLLPVPYLDGRSLHHPDGAITPVAGGADRWRAAPVLLASSHLARRGGERANLLGGPGWDLVFCDEAHHARRRGAAAGGTPNNLLALLRALVGKDLCGALLLATATPLQAGSADLWDLLDLCGLPPGWSDGPHTLERYFKQLQEPFGARDWGYLKQLLAAQVTAGGHNSDAWGDIQPRLDWASAGRLEAFAHFGLLPSERAAIPHEQRPLWDDWLRANTPVRRRVFRTTRATLKSYRRGGLLDAEVVIPNRHVADEFLSLGEARRLYERIDDYIARHYNAYLAAGGASVPLGFIMTVYRRRLTSSFRAVRRSLQRRRDALAAGRGRGAAALLDDDDRHTLEGRSALDDLPAEGDGTPDGTSAGSDAALAAEIAELDDFIAALDELPPDEPKMERLRRLIADSLNGGHRTLIIFTQYFDTLDYLRERLLTTFGRQLICYFGGRGERWDDASGAWEPLDKEQVKELFRAGQEVRIMIGTDSMSEGLNLQTCDRLINFDLPWNFMRVEQRIGRIDRIGGRPDVYVTNLFYEGTVEDDIYRRIRESHDWFSHVVGNAAPVLAATESVIQQAAMRAGGAGRPGADQAGGRAHPARTGGRSAEDRAAVDEAVADLRRVIDRLEAAPVRLQDLDAVPRHTEELQPAMTLAELGEALRNCDALTGRFEPHPEVREAWLVTVDGQTHAVTFDPHTYQTKPGLNLLTWATPLLDRLLHEVAHPAPCHS